MEGQRGRVPPGSEGDEDTGRGSACTKAPGSAWAQPLHEGLGAWNVGTEERGEN